MTPRPGHGPAQRRPDRAALAIGLTLALLGLVVAYDASRLSGGGYARIGPSAFPYIVAVSLIGFSIWTVVEAVRGDFPERGRDQGGPIIWIVGGIAAQLLLMNWVGFSIATGLLFAAGARAFGQRQFWRTIPMGILLSLLIWYAFSEVLRLRLPAGPLEQLLV